MAAKRFSILLTNEAEKLKFHSCEPSKTKIFSSTTTQDSLDIDIKKNKSKKYEKNENIPWFYKKATVIEKPNMINKELFQKIKKQFRIGKN